MKKTRNVLLIFILIFYSLISTAKTIIVNPGDDLDSKIEAASGGDVVMISPGTYGPVYLEKRDYAYSYPLVIKSDGTGVVKIKSASPTSGNALSLDKCSYIVIEGVLFEGGLTCLEIDACNHIIIKDNEMKNPGQGGIHIGVSSSYIDVIGNHIHDLGLTNPQWAEGIYVGRGSYSTGVFPDNCENIWIENNEIYNCGNGEAINIKGECFHVTVKGNKIHNIAPGTSTQYNQSALTLEGANNSIANSYRLTESRDWWVEDNEIYNVTGGYSNWDNGIMFGGQGCYILNNTVHDCDNIGVFCNSYATLDLPIYIYNNTLSSNGQDMSVGSDVSNVYYTDPGANPNVPQTWYGLGLKYVILKCDDLSLSQGEFNKNWYLFFDMVRTKKIKANLGLNGKGSDDNSVFWDAVNALDAEPYFEMWNHGYDHINIAGATQDVIDGEIIGNQNLMREKMGRGPIAYGAPSNASDINSVTALNSIPEMEYVWFFPGSIASSFKGKNLIRNGEVEFGDVSYSSFVDNYPTYKENAEKAGRDYFTLQYHPPWTDETERAEIAQIVDYCLAQNLVFLTVSEYYAIQNDVTASVSGVSLSDSSIALYPLQTSLLVARVLPVYVANKGVSWSSSNDSVATIDSTGLITAVSDGSATITVTTDDGSFTETCSVNVKSALDFEGYNVSASTDDGNIPLNTRDSSLDTRWSASGDGEWIKFDMQEIKTVSNLEMAFFVGDTRSTSFDIQISTDDTIWADLFSGSSNGTSLDLETFDFINTDGRYIRIVGHGNSSNAWNSVTEIKINLEGQLSSISQVFDDKEIKLYPNPTFDQNFTLDLSSYSNQDEFKISIFDITGKLVCSNVLNGSRLCQINVPESTGLHLVKVQLKEMSFTKTVVVF